jgi:hypothetical protein
MSIVIEASYTKKLGLPGYSSHQYSLTIRTEVAEMSQVEAESAKMYQLLQSCVDRELQNVGYVFSSANGQVGPSSASASRPWCCSEKQLRLIHKLAAKNSLDGTSLEKMVHARFGKGPKFLNRVEASELIKILFAHRGANGSAKSTD